MSLTELREYVRHLLAMIHSLQEVIRKNGERK